MSKQYLRFPALSKKLGDRSRASIQRDMENRGFPRPINLGGNSVVWDEEAVDAWVQAIAEAGYTPVPVAVGSRKGRRPKTASVVAGG